MGAAMSGPEKLNEKAAAEKCDADIERLRSEPSEHHPYTENPEIRASTIRMQAAKITELETAYAISKRQWVIACEEIAQVKARHKEIIDNATKALETALADVANWHGQAQRDRERLLKSRAKLAAAEARCAQMEKVAEAAREVTASEFVLDSIGATDAYLGLSAELAALDRAGKKEKNGG